MDKKDQPRQGCILPDCPFDSSRRLRRRIGATRIGRLKFDHRPVLTNSTFGVEGLRDIRTSLV